MIFTSRNGAELFWDALRALGLDARALSGVKIAAIGPGTSEALLAHGLAVDVLPDPRIRQELSALSQWPTIPQLFHKGELIGGCDIVTEMYESGELATALGASADAPAEAPAAAEPEPAAPMGIENRL